MKPMKIGLLSLGCPKNLVDGEVMLGLAQQAGHEITAEAADAEVIVVNTCAFIDGAKQESVDAILEMAALKKNGRCRRLVVTGCLAERYRDELRREIPEVDAVLGTGEVPAIAAAIAGGSDPAGASAAASPLTLFRRAGATAPAARRGVAARHREAIATRPLPTYLYDADTPRVITTPRHYAYVKVAEGCDYNCAFCIIPTLRGQYRSRPAASIVQEACQLAARGMRELLLISQDTTFYGTDRQDRGALARLLAQLDGIEALARVRLLYLYPTTVGDDVLDIMASSRTVCRYVDLPLQHASPSVLKRMRRPGGRATYERLLSHIRHRVPGVALRTTVIVGFPGETEAEFDELCAFVEAVGFDHLGVFTYSHEEGTAAYGLPDDVPGKEKDHRRRHLMRLQKGIVTRRHRQLAGTRTTVMVDGPSAEHPLVLQGRLEGQAPEIDPVVYLEACDAAELAPGTVLDVEITGARGYDLLARPVAEPVRLC
jgi:ribosomal protein S12 methylthiotransferase